MNLWCTQWV